MEILAIVKAVKEVLGLVKAVYDVGKIISEFFEDPSDENRQRYESLMAQIIGGRAQLQKATEAILSAVSQISQTVFREAVADKLGDMDQAETALDLYRRDQSANAGQRDIALNMSAGALADFLEYSRNKVFPDTALVVHLSELMLRRLKILRELDPGFCQSPNAKSPIQESFSIIRGVVDQMVSAITTANEIKESVTVTRKVVTIPPNEGGGKETIVTTTFSIAYANVSGTVASSGSTSTQDGGSDPDYVQAVQQLRAAATAARSKGLADDFASAAILELRGAADEAERALASCEGKMLGAMVLGRKLSFVEQANYLATRRLQGPRQALLRLATENVQGASHRGLDREEVLRSAHALVKTPLNNGEQEALLRLGESFGAAQVAMVLLNRPDCAV